MICLYLKISENFVCHILQVDSGLHKPFGSMVKFQYLVHFPSGSSSLPSHVVLCSFCTNLLHSLIIWFMVSSIFYFRYHITYICYFVAPYLFSLSHSWYLWYLLVTWNHIVCPVGWGCRIHQLHLCRGVRHPLPNECPRYNTKQFWWWG